MGRDTQRNHTNKEHRTIQDFANTISGFLRTEVIQKWTTFCDDVSDSFRTIDPADCWVIR